MSKRSGVVICERCKHECNELFRCCDCGGKVCLLCIVMTDRDYCLECVPEDDDRGGGR
jgi:hypothetical protein